MTLAKRPASPVQREREPLAGGAPPDADEQRKNIICTVFKLYEKNTTSAKLLLHQQAHISLLYAY